MGKRLLPLLLGSRVVTTSTDYYPSNYGISKVNVLTWVVTTGVVLQCTGHAARPKKLGRGGGYVVGEETV